jgi:DNA-binding transcriptional ArsR family regulator
LPRSPIRIAATWSSSCVSGRIARELAQRTGLALPAMSRHMRQLRECGLVVESHPKFDARVRIYALDPKPMAELKRWLEETEALWSTQLAAFKGHVERVS